MKKLMRLTVATITVMVFLSSCVILMAAQVNGQMKTWIGQSKQQLLMQWGPPSATFDDGNGGEVWTYESFRQTIGVAQTNSYGQTLYRPPQQYRAVRQFYIDRNGTIYSYRWQGV
jgi:hypothetical protein